jgi:ABC-type branched-subunit amino acid transport system permease subunit
MGVRSYRVKLAALSLASALAAMPGAVQAVKLGAIEPYACSACNGQSMC